MNPDACSAPLPTAPSVVSARRRRARAAHVLAGAGSRSGVAWPELSQCPEWAERAFASDGLRDTLTWAAGTWRNANALHRCIDGRVLGRVCERLGETAFAVLMQTPPESDRPVDAQLLETMNRTPQQLDAALAVSGREWLLASISSSSLRRCLREVCWPDMPEPDIPAASHAAASADISAVIEYCLPRRGESS